MNKEEILKELGKEQKKIEELKKQVENMPDDKPIKRWRAKEDNVYYYLTSPLHVCETIEGFTLNDDVIYNTGNYFKTKKQAECHRENLINKQKLKDLALELNNGIAIDWEDGEQRKYHLYLCNYIYADYTYNDKNEGTTYCLDKNFKHKAIELIGEDKLIQLIKSGI